MGQRAENLRAQSSSFIAYLLYAGWVAFFVQLFFSILFYKERTCYLDIAFQSFLIINTQGFEIQLNRFGSGFMQFFPLAGVMLNLPLKAILILYSVSFVLQNMLFYWLLIRVLKQKEIALALAITCVLLVTNTFYWIVDELKQGAAYSIFFCGMVRAMPISSLSLKGVLLILFYVLFIATALFLHPLVAVALLFVCGWMLLHEFAASLKTVIIAFALMVLLLICKHFIIPTPAYDRLKYEAINNFVHQFPHYLSLPSFLKFTGYLIKDWYLYVLIFLFIILYYAFAQQCLKAAWVVVCTLGFVLLVNVSFPEGADKNYMETYYQLLGVFVALPLAMDGLRPLPGRIALGLVALLFVLRLNTIYHAHRPFTQRVAWTQQMLQRYPGKFIVREEDAPMHLLKTAWATPYESLLLTSLQHPDSARTFIVAPPGFVRHSAGGSAAIYSVFGDYPYEKLNRLYFRPKEGAYWEVE